MAHVTITIKRDNWTTVNADGPVPDEVIVDITKMLAAMLFDAASAPAPENTDSPTTTP